MSVLPWPWFSFIIRCLREVEAGKFLDVFLVALTLFIAFYTVLNFPRYSTRIPFVDSPTPVDIILGISLVVLLLEACRRTVGMALMIITIVFIIYGFAGKYMPGMLAHRGLSIERFVDLQIMSPNGIFGMPIRVSAELVFYFILFGVFLERSGGGELFIDLAYSLTGTGQGRGGQGQRGFQRPLWNDIRKRRGQCGRGRHVHDPPDEKDGL